MMKGPMLRALLEERFRLKFHRETREVPIYSLTVAKSGLKLQPSSGGSCTQARHLGVANPGKARLRASSRPTCPGGTMAQFAQALGLSGRMVIDQTGITENFDFQVEYAPDGADLSDELTAPSIESVLRKLGLRLDQGSPRVPGHRSRGKTVRKLIQLPAVRRVEIYRACTQRFSCYPVRCCTRRRSRSAAGSPRHTSSPDRPVCPSGSRL